MGERDVPERTCAVQHDEGTGSGYGALCAQKVPAKARRPGPSSGQAPLTASNPNPSWNEAPSPWQSLC